MVGEASGRMQKADCRDEIALPAAMLAWLKCGKQRTRNSRKRFLVFFCSLFVKARVVYRLRDCCPDAGSFILGHRRAGKILSMLACPVGDTRVCGHAHANICAGYLLTRFGCWCAPTELQGFAGMSTPTFAPDTC